MTRVFVYGTLKRHWYNHHYLHGQQFVGEARTAPLYRLHDMGGYPGMVLATPEQEGLSIEGEVWDVDPTCLAKLDLLEDVVGGEYVREVIPLLPPFAEETIQGYRYLRPTEGCRDCGSRW